MEGKSHRIGGTVAALSGFLLLKDAGILLSPDTVSPTLQLVLIYGAGIYGGMWPDNDHHWESSPLKDPLSWVQNKILHTFNKPYKALEAAKVDKKSFKYRLFRFLACRHRSWQTHSELTLLGIVALFRLLGTGSSVVNASIAWLLFLGFFLGVLSHILLDMLTTEGSRFALGIICNTFLGTRVPETIRLVPKARFFATGSPWEMAIRKWLTALQYVLVAVVCLSITGIDLLAIFRL